MDKLYLAGDIMTRGSRLARQEEYDLINNAVEMDIYSPILNKSINDKKNVTEEENNKLAEKIVKADCERIDGADAIVFCPEQHALGTIVEVGYVEGRKVLAKQIKEALENNEDIEDIIDKVLNQKVYFHYEDLRDTGLNEKGWRRSFSINQFLYGVILDLNEKGIQSLEEIINEL